MTEIRPLERDDLVPVAELAARAFPGFAGRSHRALSALFAATLLDHPWVDPELPSLVATDGGRIVGFVGAQARRLRAGDQRLRGVCCSHLVVDPAHRPSALGARLLARVLGGAQELTYSDTANSFVARMFATVGGQVDQVRRLVWMRVLEPRAWAARVAAARLLAPSRVDHLLPQRSLPLAGAPETEAAERLRDQPLTAGALVEAAAELVPDGPRLEYDEPFAAWLLATLDEWFGAGRVVRRLLRDGERAAGWFAYRLEGAGRARLLQFGAAPRRAEVVLAALFAHARRHGVLVLTGRAEPQLQEALRRAGCQLAFGDRALQHARDPALLTALQSERSLLTRLDGEWW